MVLVALGERLAADLFVPPLAVFQALAPGVHEGVLDPPDPGGIIGVEVSVAEVGLVRFGVPVVVRPVFGPRRLLLGPVLGSRLVLLGRFGFCRVLFVRGRFGFCRVLGVLACRVAIGTRFLLAWSSFGLRCAVRFWLGLPLSGGVLSRRVLAGARFLPGRGRFLRALAWGRFRLHRALFVAGMRLVRGRRLLLARHPVHRPRRLERPTR
nr:hypothetical protein [Amycolatopsis lexingtonensis]